MLAISPHWSPDRDEFSDRQEKILFWDEVAEPVLRQWREEGLTSILDAGCGTGRTVERLYTAGWDPSGITYQRREVEAFELRCPRLSGRVVEGDLHALPYADEQFDAVICWDVLEHTLAPLHVLGELRRVTRPDGRLLVFLPGQVWVDCPYHILVPTIAQMFHLCYLSRWRLDHLYNASDIQAEAAIYVLRKSDECPPYQTRASRLHRTTPDV